MVPKRALRVMEGEVNRIMQLTSNSVIPIMYQVPRKTYRDFHSDLYPDTNGCRTELSVNQWLGGVNLAVPKICLDPVKRELGDAPIIVSTSSTFLYTNKQANKQTNNEQIEKLCTIRQFLIDCDFIHYHLKQITINICTPLNYYNYYFIL